MEEEKGTVTLTVWSNKSFLWHNVLKCFGLWFVLFITNSSLLILIQCIWYLLKKGLPSSNTLVLQDLYSVAPFFCVFIRVLVLFFLFSPFDMGLILKVDVREDFGGCKVQWQAVYKLSLLLPECLFRSFFVSRLFKWNQIMFQPDFKILLWLLKLLRASDTSEKYSLSK